jgi:hypothetical protein
MVSRLISIRHYQASTSTLASWRAFDFVCHVIIFLMLYKTAFARCTSRTVLQPLKPLPARKVASRVQMENTHCPDTASKYQAVNKQLQEISALAGISGLLSWDEMVGIAVCWCPSLCSPAKILATGVFADHAASRGCHEPRHAEGGPHRCSVRLRGLIATASLDPVCLEHMHVCQAQVAHT